MARHFVLLAVGVLGAGSIWFYSMGYWPSGAPAIIALIVLLARRDGGGVLALFAGAAVVVLLYAIPAMGSPGASTRGSEASYLTGGLVFLSIGGALGMLIRRR